MGRLFGTDGIRGVVNDGLDGELAYKVGLAAAQVLSAQSERKPRFFIGLDTRISGDMLAAALTAGITAAGADVCNIGVVPTPAVAYLTKKHGYDAGIMVSASHNPCEHNGIKIFNGEGFKLSDELEEAVEALVLGEVPFAPLPMGAGLGAASISDGAEGEEYISYLRQTVSVDFSGLRVLIDCANGSASATAQRLFSQLPGLCYDIISAEPDGININAGCGSTHLDGLSKLVVAGGYDLGIAFDGDADRCLCVDETGGEIDGDKMMAVCAQVMRTQGELPTSAIVATVMSNIGLHHYCQEEGFRLICTAVGDRNVLECMLENGYAIGGEQSGHMIFLALATTGDGQLTALQFLQVLVKSGAKASNLVACCPKYPQVLKNMKIASVEDKNRIMSAESLKAEIASVETLLGDDGRVLIRPSGTEALIRVMVEAKSEDDAVSYTDRLVKFIENL